MLTAHGRRWRAAEEAEAGEGKGRETSGQPGAAGTGGRADAHDATEQRGRNTTKAAASGEAAAAGGTPEPGAGQVATATGARGRREAAGLC